MDGMSSNGPPILPPVVALYAKPWANSSRNATLRNGTLGLYLALQKLGYNPCHMRTVFAGGAHELKLLLEAARAGLWGEGERYSKEDLQKWLGEYDVRCLPSFFPSITWRR